MDELHRIQMEMMDSTSRGIGLNPGLRFSIWIGRLRDLVLEAVVASGALNQPMRGANP